MSDNKYVVVTGATSGIGLSVCEQLLQNRFAVIGIGHSAQNSESARRLLLQAEPDADLTLFCGDMIQQREVQRIAQEIQKHLHSNGEDRLFALINNAGCVRSWYMTSDEGYEQQFALNHLAGFLLCYELLPFLEKGNGRVLFTSSGSHKRMKMHWEDIMFEKKYNTLLAYKQTKLCNMLTAYAVNKRYQSQGIRAYGVDPGLVRTDIGNKGTVGFVNLFWSIRKKNGMDASKAAQTFVMLCKQDEPPKGLYYGSLREQKYSAEVNEKNADRLFSLSETLCNVKYPGQIR